MVRYDVVVVGGGPAGAVAAHAAARAGARVLVLERSPRRPPRCTGLVGPALLGLLPVPRSLVLREVRALRVCAPDGTSAQFEAPSARGFVLDRSGLDRWLVERAEDAGAVVWAPAAALGLKRDGLRTTVGPVRYEVLVGADGPAGLVRSWAGLPGPEETLVGVQVEVAGAAFTDEVEISVGRDIAPGGLAWVVPAEEGVARVGVLTRASRDAGALLKRFLASRLPGARVVRWAAGLVPIGPPPHTVGDRVLVVGDAAGHTKPLTGGGLLLGARAAQAAGELAAQGRQALPAYEERWRRALGPEISFGLRARRVFLGLDDSQLSRIVRALGHPELRALVAEEGDVDRPSGLARALVARPRAWGSLLPLLRAVGGLAALLPSSPDLPEDTTAE